MKKEGCPKYDNHNYEEILEWGAKNINAKLIWENEFYSGKTKQVHVDDKLALWTLLDDHGFLGLDRFKKEEEEEAKRAAALFIYLWNLGVNASLAEHLAQAYVADCKRQGAVFHSTG